MRYPIKSFNVSEVDTVFAKIDRPFSIVPFVMHLRSLQALFGLPLTTPRIHCIIGASLSSRAKEMIEPRNTPLDSSLRRNDDGSSYINPRLLNKLASLEIPS